MPRVKVNGWRFRYRQAGRGPDVVLLPSIVRVACSRRLFDVLTANFRVTVYEPRGGKVSSGGWSAPDIADDLRGLQMALRLGPLYLVAHRAASIAALHAAVLYPDMVAGLVLNEPCLPQAGEDASSNGRSGVTTERILLIEPPVVALCCPDSTALPLCQFLQANLPNCKAAMVPDDPTTLVATIREHIHEMAGLPRSESAPPAARESKPGVRSQCPRWWPDAGDGHSVARWITRVSAWGL
jgi:hypothetical protein